MPWESLGSCGHSTSPGDTFEFRLGIEYLKLVCGKVPEGCELGIMWGEFDGAKFGEIVTHPSGVGLYWDSNELPDAPWEYISRCETALSIFHESVNWWAIHPDAVTEQFRKDETSCEADEGLEEPPSTETQIEPDQPLPPTTEREPEKPSAVLQNDPSKMTREELRAFIRTGLKNPGGTPGSGPVMMSLPRPKIDFETLRMAQRLGEIVFRDEGITDYKAWVAAMVENVGEEVRPYLPPTWDRMQLLYGDEEAQDGRPGDESVGFLEEEPPASLPTPEPAGGTTRVGGTGGPGYEGGSGRMDRTWSTRRLMANKKRIVVALGTILVVVAGLFPSWSFVAVITRYGDVVKKSAGYSFLFSPPTMQLVKKNPGTSYESEEEPTTGRDPKSVSVELDWNPLLAEWITILLATGGLLLFFHTARNKSE